MSCHFHGRCLRSIDATHYVHIAHAQCVATITFVPGYTRHPCEGGYYSRCGIYSRRYGILGLVRCSSCGVWKTRVLISRAVVPLVTINNMERVLLDLLRMMTTEDQNSLHTTLLILQRLVQERRNLPNCCTQKSPGVSWLSGWLLENLLTKRTLGTE